MRVALLLLLGACHALPPPPAIPFHANTRADPVGEVTVSVVLGVASQVLGGGGLGLAVRVERQETERTALGLEITGGRAETDKEDSFWAFAVRGYGKGTPRTHDWVAVTYGAGVSVLTTGMVTLQAHGGGAVSYYHAYFAPYLSIGVAGALPLLDGRPFGHLVGRTPPGQPPTPGEWAAPPGRLLADLYLFGSVGLGVPIGDTGNVPSLDVSLAQALRADNGLAAVSLADTQH